MCKLSTWSSSLRKILRYLQKRKEKNWGENSYASVARKANATKQDNKQNTRGKIDPVGSQRLAKFQEHLKKLHSAEFYQAPAQNGLGMRKDPML